MCFFAHNSDQYGSSKGEGAGHFIILYTFSHLFLRHPQDSYAIINVLATMYINNHTWYLVVTSRLLARFIRRWDCELQSAKIKTHCRLFTFLIVVSQFQLSSWKLRCWCWLFVWWLWFRLNQLLTPPNMITSIWITFLIVNDYWKIISTAWWRREIALLMEKSLDVCNSLFFGDYYFC